MLRRCNARNFNCSDIRRPIRIQQSKYAHSTQASTVATTALSVKSSWTTTTTQTDHDVMVRSLFLLQRDKQRRHYSYYVSSQHPFVNGTRYSSRYQTTLTSISDSTTKKEENEKKRNDEERLLDNFEEIVDIPSSAFEEVIDRSKFTNAIPIPMPDLGTSNGNSPDRYSLVKEWFFQKGDIIQHEDVLCDIETPDFTFGMETDDEEITIMGEILVPAGQPVPDGTVLCYTIHESKGSDNNNDNPMSLSEHSTRKQDDDDDEDEVDRDDNEKANEEVDDKSGSEKNKP